MRYGLLKILVAGLIAAGTIYAGLSVGSARTNVARMMGPMTGPGTGPMTGMSL